MNPTRLTASLAFLLLSHLTAEARLGETENQCNARYGTPKRVAEIVPGCSTNEYDYHGFKVRVAFAYFNGPAIKMTFGKPLGPFLKDDEIEAILKANTEDGMEWKRAVHENEASKKLDPFTRIIGALFVNPAFGMKAWIRSDGAVAELQPQKLGLILHTQESFAREKKAKEDAEAQRKAAIPNF